MVRRTPRYDCDCDAALVMEELGVGAEEILQYVHAILPRRELQGLIRGLERILERTGSNAPVGELDPYSAG